MKKHIQLILRLKDERGTIIIVVALAMAMLIGFAALAVDIGYALVTRNELQNVADSAALAATRQLGYNYEGMSYEAQQGYVCDPTILRAVAKDVAEKNQAGGKYISINDDDVIIGRWDSTTKTLTGTLNQPDAVKVTVRRDSSANEPIVTFFGRIFGIDTMNISASATAALTGQSTAGEGGLPIPVAISKKWFESPGFCDQPIKFYPTGDLDGCAGWNTYESSPANAAKLSDLLTQLKDGTFQSPETIAGETSFIFTGGTVASAFEEMKALFDAMKGLNDGIIDADDDPNTWTTSVAVYNYDDCSNPRGEILIVGFATVTITEVLETPSKTIMAKVKCDYAEAGRGSGGNYGTKGTIPGLVQ